MSVILASNFNAAKLTLSELKKLDNGSSQSYINYDSKKLRVQVPRMPIPMDAGDYQGNEKFKVQLSFRDRDSNPKVAAYYKMIEDIDNYVVDQALKNAGKWFKKPNISRDLVMDRFTPSIRFAKDKEGNLKPYPPTQPVALKKRNGAFDAELYDKERRIMEGQTPVEVLRRGAEITSILECTGIWVTDKGFGLTWKLFQAVVNQAAEGAEAGCAIVDEDEEVSAAAVPVVAKAAPVKVAAPAIVDDDEEADLMAAVKPTVAAPPAHPEEDVDEDEVQEAPPVPAKKVAAPAATTTTVKKVVKKVVKPAA